MKRRCELSGGEVEALVQGLSDQLAHVALSTQPEIAAKIVRLVTKGEAGIADFAKVICNDAALSGRMLRLANSAYFAQREPVTSVDRACVLLGIDRLKTLSLGFYLSNSADRTHSLSRRVWGQGIFRGTLAAELAAGICPRRTAEAFVIGLMADSGVALMPRLLGAEYDRFVDSPFTPAKLFRIEFEELPFTHVDVTAALARLWRLPELLSKPLEWHHVRPGADMCASDTHALHRVAYYVGAVDLEEGSDLPAEAVPMPTIAMSLLGVDSARLAESIQRACREYRIIVSAFSEVADALRDIESLGERVHVELIEAMERSLLDVAVSGEIVETGSQFSVNGHAVAIEPGGDGSVTAYLFDSRGTKLVSYKFEAKSETAANVLAQLGLDDAPLEVLTGLGDALKRLAA